MSERLRLRRLVLSTSAALSASTPCRSPSNRGPSLGVVAKKRWLASGQVSPILMCATSSFLNLGVAREIERTMVIIVLVRVQPRNGGGHGGGGGGGGRRRRVAARPRAAPIPWWRPRRILLLLGVAVGVASGARGDALRREDGRDGDAPGGCESEDRGVVGDLRTPEARRGGDEGQGARGKGQGARGRIIGRRTTAVRHSCAEEGATTMETTRVISSVGFTPSTRSPRVHHAFTTRSPCEAQRVARAAPPRRRRGWGPTPRAPCRLTQS